MTTLKRELLSLNALTTFEVAARRLSFTRAAEELHVTQAAVSRQIQRLEGQLGTPLFRRVHRQLELTTAGRQLLQAVGDGLNEIAMGVRRVRIATNAPLVTISATIGFATYWLMPRAHAFRAANADIDLRIVATDRESDVAREEVDIAIVYGDEHLLGEPGCSLLAREVVLPVSSPAYLARRPGLKSAEPSRLTGEQLIHLDPQHWSELQGSIIDWPVWFDQFGVRRVEGLRGLRINNYPLVIESVLAGHGIALGWRPVIDDLLDKGRLVVVGRRTIEGRMGYYVATPNARTLSEAAQRVHAWILSAARAHAPPRRHP